MSFNVSTIFNVVILVFIGFEIINSAFEAGTHVPTSIRLPTTFLASERQPPETYEKTITLASLQPKIEVEQSVEDLSLTVAYSEYTNPHRPVSAGPANASETSYYLEWIRKDLQPWANTGITAELVEAAAYNWSCMGERMRFNIVNGSLWVEHLSWRPKEGWYPAKLGPGNMSAKGKIPYIIFALLDTLRAYPGQIPDVEVAVHTADFPCIHKPTDGRAPPITFASNSGDAFADIVFPDYSYYGHEHSWFWSPDNTYLMGWTVQQQYTAQKWANMTLLDRVPQVMWRGRTYDPEFPGRDALRREFVKCPERFRTAGMGDAAALWNVEGGSYMLTDLGDFRYTAYLESEAWVTNLRLKLASGSVLLSNVMRFHEFFTRALVPGYHYVEMDDAHLCNDALRKVAAMEARIKGAKHPLPRGANYSVPAVWDWDKFEYTPRLQQHRAAQAALRGRRLAEEPLDPALDPDRSQREERVEAGEGADAGPRGVQDAASRARLLQRDAPPRVPFKAKASGLQPPRLAQGRTPMQEHDRLLGQPDAFVWGKAEPWEIPVHAGQFVRDHLRMADVRLYIRDLLREYAALQAFYPQKKPNSVCYTGRLLLEQFGKPHMRDEHILRQSYPWLEGFTNGCPQLPQPPPKAGKRLRRQHASP